MTITRSIFDRPLAMIAGLHARRQHRRFLQATESARHVQLRNLLIRLRRHGESDFGRKYGFARIRSYEDFISAVPVQTYDDIRPYVERVMAGDVRALFRPGQRVFMFAMTSGTTDQPKYVPVTPEFLRVYRRGWNVFGIKALLDHPDAFTRPILQVTSSMDDHRSDSGLPCGAISGLLAATQKRIVRRYYLIPPWVSEITDADARYYTIMRLAVGRDVGWIVTASPATPLKLAKTATQHAAQLIRDIHDGTLSPPGALSTRLRERLTAGLKPDPVGADRLTSHLDRHGALLPKHYWRLAFLANWTGGTLGLHLRDFPRYFGETPVRDIGLLATEGRVSIPLEDATPTGVLDVTGNFFEFAEAEADSEDRGAVRQCHDLDTGGVYRVIMTTDAGFYRYDLGDHVKVHGHWGQVPILEFLHRGAHVSSMTGEKLTEWQVVQAVGHAADALGIPARDFVLAPVWGDPPHYRLHIERIGDDPGNTAPKSDGTAREPRTFSPRDRPVESKPRNPSTKWDRLAVIVDQRLGVLNVEYASKRSSKRLGGIEIHPLSPGFLARMDARPRTGRNKANEQFKHQYLYTRPGEDGVLLSSGAT